MMLSAIRSLSDALKVITIEPNGLHLRGGCRLLRQKVMNSDKKRRKQQLKHSLTRGRRQTKQRNRSENGYQAVCNGFLGGVLKIVGIEANGQHLRCCCRLMRLRLMLSENPRMEQQLNRSVRGGIPETKQRNRTVEMCGALCNSVAQRCSQTCHH